MCHIGAVGRSDNQNKTLKFQFVKSISYLEIHELWNKASSATWTVNRPSISCVCVTCNASFPRPFRKLAAGLNVIRNRTDSFLSLSYDNQNLTHVDATYLVNLLSMGFHFSDKPVTRK